MNLIEFIELLEFMLFLSIEAKFCWMYGEIFVDWYNKKKNIKKTVM